MGVPGLQSYLDATQKSSKTGNIAERARKRNEPKKGGWFSKKEKNARELDKVLIVDLLALARKPYVGLNPWFGGDFIQYKRNWKKLIGKFETEGIKLMFVSKSTRDNREKGKRELQNFVKPSFDKLKKGKLPSDVIDGKPDKFNLGDILSNSVLPKSGLEGFIRHELGQDLYIVHTGDENRHIVAMAEKFNAFGILVQDSDYYCHQFLPDISIFSAKELNIDTLNTVSYDRSTLAESLKLSLDQMPMLATLKGNDVMTNRKCLTKFHRQLLEGIKDNEKVDPLKVIPAIAKWIRKEKPDVNRIKAEFDELVDENDEKEPNADDTAKMIEESLESYIRKPKTLTVAASNDEPDNWLNIKNLHLKFNDKDFALIQSQKFYDFDAVMEDKQAKAPLLSTLNKQARKNLYAVLFMERPETEVEEHLLHVNAESKVKVGSLPPVLKQEHPGLLALWNKRQDNASKEDEAVRIKRWKLFAWILTNKTSIQIPEFLMTTDPKQLYLVCQLLMFQNAWKKPVLAQHEAWAFILMNLRQKNMPEDDILKITLEGSIPDCHAIHLATLFTGSIVPFVSECLGHVIPPKNLLPCNNFEANLFHKIYQDLQKSGLDDIATEPERLEVDRIWSFISKDF